MPLNVIIQQFKRQWESSPPIPDLKEYINKLDNGDSTEVLTLIKIDAKYRDHQSIDSDWKHYNSLSIPLHPESTSAKWLIEREVKRIGPFSSREKATEQMNNLIGSGYESIISNILNEFDESMFEGIEIEVKSKDNDKWHLRTDEEIGGYKLSDFLGRGGLGEVYEATRIGTGQKVAIKLLKREGLSDNHIKLFEIEKEVMTRLGHPYVARIYNSGVTTKGEPFIAIEFIDGMNLANYCDHNHLSINDRLRLFIEICKGVEHIHNNGFMHRDLSHDNILVTMKQNEGDEDDGNGDEIATPKIIDLGVAKLIDKNELITTQYNNNSDHYAGKLAYMSPEVANTKNEDIDQRTDIFSLGVILYDLISGQLPITIDELKAMSASEREEAIVDTPRRPMLRAFQRMKSSKEQSNILEVRKVKSTTKFISLLTSRLKHIPMTALRLEPDKRYEHVSTLRLDVENYLTGKDFRHAESEPLRDRFIRNVRRHKYPYAAILIIILTLIGGIIGTTIGMNKAHTETQKAVRATKEKTDALQKEKEATVKAEKETERAIKSEEEQARLAIVAKQRENEAIKSNELTMKTLTIFEKSYGKLTPLHLAAAYDNIEEIEKLIKAGAEIESLGPDNKTPIQVAAEFGNIKAVQTLVNFSADTELAIVGAIEKGNLKIVRGIHDAGIDITKPYTAAKQFIQKQSNSTARFDGITALHHACGKGHLDIVKYLLSINADPNSICIIQNNVTFTPLFAAAQNGHASVVQALIKAGANEPTEKNIFAGAESPLHIAAKNGHTDVVEALAKVGFNLELEDNIGRRAIHWAVDKRHIRVVAILYKHGANINAMANNEVRDTPIHIAASTPFHHKVLVQLAKLGANPTLINGIGFSPSHSLINQGDLEGLKILHQYGLSLNSTARQWEVTTNTRTATIQIPLIYQACGEGQLEIVKWLLANGTDPHKDSGMGTAIQEASEKGRIECVKLLVNGGVHPSSGNTTQEYPSIILAGKKDHWEVVKFLLEKGANGINAVKYFTNNGYDDAIEQLAILGVPLDTPDSKSKMRPIHYAALNGHPEVIEMLIKHGVDPNSIAKFWAPLHHAAISGQDKAVSVLIKNKTNPNINALDNGRTALHMAASEGHVNVISALANHANFNLTDSLGQTALEIAVRKHHNQLESIRALVEGGALLNMPLGENKSTVLHIAMGSGTIDTVKLLLELGSPANVYDSMGLLPIHYGIMNDNFDRVTILWQHSKYKKFKTIDGRSLLHFAITHSANKCIDHFLNNGFDINQRGDLQHTLLHDAVRLGKLTTTVLLIKRGANISATDVDGWDVIHHAANNSHNEILRHLIDMKTPMILDNWNSSAMHQAGQGGNTQTIDILNKAGLGIKSKNKFNLTPLHYAAKYKNTAVAQHLLKLGADPNAKDKDGNTPADIAKAEGYFELENLIRNYKR